jgi:hypothetical protein
VRFLVKKTADLGIKMADLSHFLANFGDLALKRASHQPAIFGEIMCDGKTPL